jgi:hypothetical protein
MKKINLQNICSKLLLFSLGVLNGILIAHSERIADIVFPILFFVMLVCAFVLFWFESRNRKQASKPT